MSAKKRIVWIDYIKIIACLIVMISHYSGLYSFCEPLPEFGSFSKWLFSIVPQPFNDGNFWVFVFCLLSGYLSSFKKIKNIKELLTETILRYLRFLIPILFLFLCIYFFNKYIGFSSSIYGAIYNNQWIGQYMTGDIYLKKVIKHAFLFKDRMNTPLWVIKPIFIGNVLLLIRSFLKNKLNVKYFDLLVIIVLGYTSYVNYESNSLYMLATYCGTFLDIIKKQFTNSFSSAVGIVCISIIYSLFTYFLNMPFYKITYLNMFAGLMFVILIKQCPYFNNLKCKYTNLSSISFWIYLIHFPVICSFSCYFILLFKNYALGFWTTLILTILLVVVISFVMSKWFDNVVNKLLNRLKIVLNNINF